MGNVFSFNGWSNYRHEPKTIDDGNMALLPEVGFKKAFGNAVANPNILYDTALFDAYYVRASGAEASKLKRDQWTTLRQELGLAPAEVDLKVPFAPAVAYRQAAHFFPRNAAIEAGARKRLLASRVGD